MSRPTTPGRTVTPRKVLLAPLDPVHDIGLKMIRRHLEDRGHVVTLLPPDQTPEEVAQAAAAGSYDCLLVSRTVSYESAEALARLADLLDSAGVRSEMRVAVGGMAIRPELAAEMGYDAGFAAGTSPEAAAAFVEGVTYRPADDSGRAAKPDITAGHAYRWNDRKVESLLGRLAEKTIAWGRGLESPAIERARIVREMLAAWGAAGGDLAAAGGPESADLAELERRYQERCDQEVVEMRQGRLPAKCRAIGEDERARALEILAEARRGHRLASPSGPKRPVVFVQYGTGCPIMDAMHAVVAGNWGAQGTVHFDPAWSARREGLPKGLVAWSADGTFYTEENLRFFRRATGDDLLWQVRAHRGLNTPESVVWAAAAGADLTKINPVYGSLGGGTDPERLLVDSLEAMRLAAEYRLPFDVVTNEELCGVPAHKALAGMLVAVSVALRLGARPILQPLFCYSPEAMLEGFMEQDYVDWNAAKVICLKSLVDAPIWLGAPIGFLTHTEERAQSAVTTSLHAGLAASCGVDAFTIASTDEAYSRGPITVGARTDSLRGVQEIFRFLGRGSITPTGRAMEMAERLRSGILEVLAAAERAPSFRDALYQGVFGTTQEGANPGRAGKGTVRSAR